MCISVTISQRGNISSSTICNSLPALSPEERPELMSKIMTPQTVGSPVCWCFELQLCCNRPAQLQPKFIQDPKDPPVFKKPSGPTKSYSELPWATMASSKISSIGLSKYHAKLFVLPGLNSSKLIQTRNCFLWVLGVCMACGHPISVTQLCFFQAAVLTLDLFQGLFEGPRGFQGVLDYADAIG